MTKQDEIERNFIQPFLTCFFSVHTCKRRCDVVNLDTSSDELCIS